MVRANNRLRVHAKGVLRGAAFFAIVLMAGTAFAQTDAGGTGMDLLRGVRNATAPGQLPTTLGLVILITVISLAPAILVMTTSFTRIIVVLGFLRQAMATQQSPPNQVLIGLALFLTLNIMAPTYKEAYTKGIAPYMRGEITSQDEALNASLKPLRSFMFRQVGAKDLALFLEIGKLGRPNTPDDVPTHVLIPAFILSELRIAFQIGFIIYIPFLIIDMVVASTLMAMGMMMLPPIFVSLPFKIILFVLADGWYLLIGSLVRSFH
ncbi:MAG: flagellar type III secretion system pore protein FliP [Candidatus Hydrogenedentes bacterium]|nr:flagellar type III secretion system pore protein FliP [Candidatus Hydrogenedentota bacterium]